MPAPPATVENGQRTPGASPQQHQPPPLKPASPKNNLNTIPEDKPTSTPVVEVPPPQSMPLFHLMHLAFLLLQPLSFHLHHPSHEELGAVSHESSDTGSSPRFMLDWSQVQMPMGFDGLVQPNMIMNPDGPFSHPMQGRSTSNARCNARSYWDNGSTSHTNRISQTRSRISRS
ncbi:hypothetical protein MRB53_038554 [Persea americana]|nr:hypothetical protein MRB53_038554 [Persea americana]